MGLGRAGCRIANLFFQHRGKIAYNGVLIDADKSDLQFLQHRYRILLGEKVVDGNGTGGDVELGKEMLHGERLGIVERMDSIRRAEDCLFVFAGLGGGIGGAVNVLLEEFKKSYIEPAYLACVLPGEEDYEKAAINFSNNFKDVLEHCDAVFPIDNDLLRERRRLRGAYSKINEKVFRHFNSLFEIGEYRSKEELGGHIVATSDLINTLKGVSSVGIGRHELKERGFGVVDRREVDKPEFVVSLAEKSLDSLLMQLDLRDAQKALAVVSGPKHYLDFLGSIPARLWLEKTIASSEVRGGDMASLEKNELEVITVLSGIKKSDRISHLYQIGRMLQSRATYTDRLASAAERLKKLENATGEMQGEIRQALEDLRAASEQKEEQKEEKDAPV